MRAHAGSPVLDEARAALKSVLDKQIADLAKAGSVGELRKLEQHRHADLVSAELRQAIASVYQREIARYRQHAGGAHTDGRRCVEGLLQYASTHGPVVELRTLEDPGGSLDTADLAVKHSPYFPGSTAVPSQYFDDDALARRAKAGAQALLTSMQRAFGRDVLELRLGSPLPPEQADHLDGLTAPTLVIERKTVLSGTFANASPPVVLVGVALTYVARCAVPAAAPMLVVKDASWKPPTAEILKSGDSAGEDLRRDGRNRERKLQHETAASARARRPLRECRSGAEPRGTEYRARSAYLNKISSQYALVPAV